MVIGSTYNLCKYRYKRSKKRPEPKSVKTLQEMQSLFYYKTQEEIFNKLKLDKRDFILEKQIPRKIMECFSVELR